MTGHETKTDEKETKNSTTNSRLVKNFIVKYWYDIIASIISLLDLVTDVLVMINFYKNGHFGFFNASLCILLFAQIAYVSAFIAKFSSEYGFTGNFILFLVLLFFAPFLSFIFMLVDSNQSKFAKFIHKRSCFDLNFSRRQFDSDEQSSALYQWMVDKMNRHIGFILEAATEAFPQSVGFLALFFSQQWFSTIKINKFVVKN